MGSCSGHRKKATWILSRIRSKIVFADALRNNAIQTFWILSPELKKKYSIMHFATRIKVKKSINWCILQPGSECILQPVQEGEKY